MRNLFLGLVLVNLAFAAWSAWIAPSERRGRPADEGLPELTLVSEVPADLRSGGSGELGEANTDDASAPGGPEIAPITEDAGPDVGGGEAENVAAASPEAAAGSCTSVGPFRELSQAAAAAATLRGEGFEPQQRVVEGDLWSGYWVYIRVPTEEQANDTLVKVRDGVREARIPDAYVIRNSDSGHLVSLGVFSEIGRVTRLREEVRALGFEPEVVDRTRRATVYWVDVALAPEQTLDFDTLQPPGRIIRLEQRACEAVPG